jgi:hypothetical protein
MRSDHIDYWLDLLIRLQAEIRRSVRDSMQRNTLEASSDVVEECEGDVIFRIDKVSEETISAFFAAHADPAIPFLLIAEGISESQPVVFPRSASTDDVQYRLILDPIDGTRSIMFDKRSAWALAGVAPNKGTMTTLEDIELAVQTEIPISKQGVADVCWAVKGQGAEAKRVDLRTGEQRALKLQPSQADTIQQGYASIVRFCPGPKELLGRLEEEMVDVLFGGTRKGQCLYFEDQYISTGGQLYELMVGHDRFIADLRALTAKMLQSAGRWSGLCCHPYDLCTELIAREAGVIVTDHSGGSLRVPLDTTTDVAWLGYANRNIQRQLEPVVAELIEKHL